MIDNAALRTAKPRAWRTLSLQRELLARDCDRTRADPAHPHFGERTRMHPCLVIGRFVVGARELVLAQQQKATLVSTVVSRGDNVRDVRDPKQTGCVVVVKP